MSIKISACTITKNEEKNIARSIESYKNYVDEIIIVDTGSTDNTVQIAESLGAKVIHFEWINDFSAAKNCAIDAATGDWILFLDADEWIKDNGGMKLQTVVQRAITNGFNAISLRMLNLDDDGSLTEITSSLRIFANKPNIRYIRKIHEHLVDSANSKPLVSMRAEDLVLNHSGYAESISKTKINRNKELLEKNYMNGDAEAIDYFYLARENLLENPEYARKFLDILLSDEEKMEAIQKLDVANNIQDLKMKLIKKLETKYSFEERMYIIDEAIKDFPDDPTYYFFKYLTLVNSGKYDNLELLYKAFDLDKIYETKVGGNNNAFARYKADALNELGAEAFRENNNLKAMEYFVQAIQEGQKKEEILKGLLYIIEPQQLNEKIVFLSSIFDVNNEETLKFIVQTLRLTKYTDVFVYYFVKYYKIFGEVDVSLFTSMLVNKNYKDAAEKYLTILINESDKRAENLVVSAVVAGELKEFYNENKIYFSSAARKILNVYFEDLTLEDMTREEEELIGKIISEIIYVSPDSVLEKIKKICNYNENVLRAIIRIYSSNKNYKELIKEINTFIEKDLSDEFAGEVTTKLGECYYAMNDFANAQLYFNQAIEIGYLDVNLARLYDKLLTRVQIDDSLKTKFAQYKYVLERFIRAHNYMLVEKIEDRDDELTSKNVMDFENVVSNSINLTESFAKKLFDYANKLFDMNNLYLAEEYYKILIRCNYNIGKCYYNLGKIYNILGAIDVSYLCYDRAFRTSINFPESILPENHKNTYYLYSQNGTEEIKICPICGKESKLINCYQYIEDKDLEDNSNLIVKYRSCDECSHVFAENYNKTEKYLEKVENKNEYISNIFDVAEKLNSDEKIVIVDETDLALKVLGNEFDATYIKGSFERSTNLEKLLKEISNQKERKLITVLNNKDSLLNEDVDMPLWAKPGVVNAYSKQSIKKLLEDNGYNNIKIYDSKFIPSKMTVVASM